MKRRDFVTSLSLLGGGIALAGCYDTFKPSIMPESIYKFKVNLDETGTLIDLNGINIGERPFSLKSNQLELLNNLNVSENLSSNCELNCDLNGTQPISSKEVALEQLTLQRLLPLEIGGLEMLAFNMPQYKQDGHVYNLGFYIGDNSLGKTDIDWTYRTSDFFIRFSYETHYIGGCIRRNATHMGVLVRDLKKNKMVCDYHICGWWEGWNPCVGVYESKSGWCIKSCGSDMYGGIKNAVLGILYSAIGAYVAFWVIDALATAIATASLGALVAIPGVPPPP